MRQRPRNETPLVVFVTTLVQALVTMVVVIPSAIAPEFAKALGLEPAMIGLQIGLTYGGAMILSIISGSIVKRWGALRSSQIALVLALIGASLMAIPVLSLIAIGAFICGLGYALTNPPASHLLQKIKMEKDRNFIFSIKQTSVPIGGMAAGAIAPPIALYCGWQAPLLISSGIILFTVFLIQPLRQRWDSDRDPRVLIFSNPLADFAVMWRNTQLRLFAFAAFFYSAMQLSVTTFAVTLLVSDLKFNLIKAGLVLALMQTGGVAGRLFWGWLADRVKDGSAVLLSIALISTGAALATSQLSQDTDQIYIYILFILFSFAAVGWNGIAMAEISRLALKGTISAATGSVLVITFAGILFGPPAFTCLFVFMGTYTSTFGVFALVSALGFLFVLAARY